MEELQELQIEYCTLEHDFYKISHSATYERGIRLSGNREGDEVVCVRVCLCVGTHIHEKSTWLLLCVKISSLAARATQTHVNAQGLGADLRS